MDEGPVIRRAATGLRARARAAVQQHFPERWHPLYATRWTRRANADYELPVNPRYRILVVNHYFDQDISWLRQAALDISVIEVPYAIFREAALSELPAEAERFPGYYAPELAEGRARYREHLERIFTAIAAEYPYDAVVATSDLFWWAREFKPILRDRGVPFFVLEKEGLMTPHFYEAYSRDFRVNCRPIADHHLVWSERQSAFWQLCGQKPECISVVGQPRSDFWTHPECWPSREDLGLELRAERPLVTFFSYEPWFYLPWEWYLSGGFTWEPLLRATNDALVHLARRHPGVDFVVKTHPQQTVSGLEDTVLPPNLRIIGGAKLGNPLLLNADVLIMFQSTATIEAMFRDIPIVYPFFGRSVTDHVDSLLPFHEHGVTAVARSREEVVAAVEEGLTRPRVTREVSAARRLFLSDYLHRPDGQAAYRALDRMGELLDARGK